MGISTGLDCFRHPIDATKTRERLSFASGTKTSAFVVVCERLILDCCPPDVTDAVLLVLVALVGFDDDEVDDEVRGGKGVVTK